MKFELGKLMSLGLFGFVVLNIVGLINDKDLIIGIGFGFAYLFCAVFYDSNKLRTSKVRKR